MLLVLFGRCACSTLTRATRIVPNAYRHTYVKSSRRCKFLRNFSITPRHRKDERQIQAVQHQVEERTTDARESIKPESLQTEKSTAPARNDPLLSEQTVSNKEQRKADWAIMKEMARYLWPKVRSASWICEA